VSLDLVLSGATLLCEIAHGVPGTGGAFECARSTGSAFTCVTDAVIRKLLASWARCKLVAHGIRG
jgi:hypothetical protein